MTMTENTYDRTDTVRREAVFTAGPLRMAAYTVRDPETGGHGPTQFHMTYDNTVMALMGSEAAKLFASFVSRTLDLAPVPVDLLFSGASPEGLVFCEAEVDGRSVSVGRWLDERPDGLRPLRVMAVLPKQGE